MCRRCRAPRAGEPAPPAARWRGPACRSAGGRPRQPAREHAVARHREVERAARSISTRPGCRARTRSRRPRRPRPPPRPKSASPTCAAKACPSADRLDRHEVDEDGVVADVDERHGGQAEPRARAAACAPGSRTSPAMLGGLPPAAEREERRHEAPGERGQRAAARRRAARRTAAKCATVPPGSEAKPRATSADEQPSFSERRPRSAARAPSRTPSDVHGGERGDRGDGHEPRGRRARAARCRRT